MTPDFCIRADNIDVTAAVRDRLIMLSVVDEAGLDADTAEIRIDDREAALELPRTGARLDIRMGYKEQGLSRMGLYVVDEINCAGPPSVMTIRARAADLRQGLKSPKTRAWNDVSLGDLLSAVAAEHGYTSRCAEELAVEWFEHLDQVDESDLHLLTRLARDRGAVAKPAADMLLFVPRGEARTATGRDLPETSVVAPDASSWEVVIAERGKYASVTARWYDSQAAQERTVVAGDGEPVFTIGRRYPDQAAAESAAKSRLESFERGVATLRLTCPGDTRFVAEGPLRLEGFRSGVDGTWVAQRVTHRMDGRGYQCDIEAEVKT